MDSLSFVFSKSGPFQPKIFLIHLMFLIGFIRNVTLLLSPLQSIPSAYNIRLTFVNQHSRPFIVHLHRPLWIVSGFHIEILTSSLTALLAIAMSSALLMLFSPLMRHSFICLHLSKFYPSCQAQHTFQLLSEDFYVHPWGSDFSFLAIFMPFKFCASQLPHSSLYCSHVWKCVSSHQGFHCPGKLTLCNSSLGHLCFPH